MEKLCVFFVLALLANGALGAGLRQRRQVNPNNGDNLDDRYGWGWPVDDPGFPGAIPSFPGQSWPFPLRPQVPQQRTTTTIAPATNGNGAGQPADTAACIRNCPVTPEYNPVCGSNFRTYDNPGRLTCAQYCGEDVRLLRSSPCPATTAAPPS